MSRSEIVIAGAGVIGLTLALTLSDLGEAVTVFDTAAAGAASRAAAGMLAAKDPANPPELTELAALSLSLYPALLRRVEELTGSQVPFETAWTLEASDAEGSPDALAHRLLPERLATRFRVHPEWSLDPRKLMGALRDAVIAAGTRILVSPAPANDIPASAVFIDCRGAWSRLPTRPVKGQMLRLAQPAGTLQDPELGNVVVRTPEVYIVPRLDGTAVVGATIEDAGFNVASTDDAVATLRARAATLVPALQDAKEVDRWAGLRPRTPDDLPLIGSVGSGSFVAAGHFRNGILLAPATAHVIADLLQGRPTAVDLAAFDPHRFFAGSGPLIGRTW